MATNTDRVFAAATEALQRINNVKFGISITANAPPQLTRLDDSPGPLRERISCLTQFREEQRNKLWEPLAVYARQVLEACTKTCDRLDKGTWTQDASLSLRSRVLTSERKQRRIFAHHQALSTWQDGLDLINGAVKS